MMQVSKVRKLSDFRINLWPWTRKSLNFLIDKAFLVYMKRGETMVELEPIKYELNSTTNH